MTGTRAGSREGDLIVPRGSLVVIIGPAGSGKSTLAEERFPLEAILSSDAFRAHLGMGEADQSVTEAAFAALHRVLERRLMAGQTTIVDATSLTHAARAALLDRARHAGATAVALVLDLPPSLVMARNAGRAGRVVPEPAIRRQIAMLVDVTDVVLRREGFAMVRRLRSPEEVTALRVLPGQVPGQAPGRVLGQAPGS